jgi:hypothetical protein
MTPRPNKENKMENTQTTPGDTPDSDAPGTRFESPMEPFPQPRTIPTGWDLSALLSQDVQVTGLEGSDNGESQALNLK